MPCARAAETGAKAINSLMQHYRRAVRHGSSAAGGRLSGSRPVHRHCDAPEWDPGDTACGRDARERSQGVTKRSLRGPMRKRSILIVREWTQDKTREIQTPGCPAADYREKKKSVLGAGTTPARKQPATLHFFTARITLISERSWQHSARELHRRTLRPVHRSDH